MLTIILVVVLIWVAWKMLVLGVKSVWGDSKNSMCGIFAASIILGLV